MNKIKSELRARWFFTGTIFVLYVLPYVLFEHKNDGYQGIIVATMAYILGYITYKDN